MAIDAIPAGANSYGVVLDETDAYKQDVVTRPDSVCAVLFFVLAGARLTGSSWQASLADYERVPVALFGAALLRGMGWKEGTAASRTRSGRVEPWLPAARPALLGIGAKERPAEDIPGAAKGKLGAKPERRYVPVVRLERDVRGMLCSCGELNPLTPLRRARRRCRGRRHGRGRCRGRLQSRHRPIRVIGIGIGTGGVYIGSGIGTGHMMIMGMTDPGGKGRGIGRGAGGIVMQEIAGSAWERLAGMSGMRGTGGPSSARC